MQVMLRINQIKFILLHIWFDSEALSTETLNHIIYTIKPHSYNIKSINKTSRWCKICKNKLIWLTKQTNRVSQFNKTYTTNHSSPKYFLNAIMLYYIFYMICLLFYLEASEPKCANPILNTIGVNSLNSKGLHFIC